MTVRQRIGVALSKTLTTEDWEKVIASARDAGRVADLARLADQAFGKSRPEEEAQQEADPIASLTRAERSSMIARLQEEARAQREAALDGQDPRDDEAA